MRVQYNNDNSNNKQVAAFAFMRMKWFAERCDEIKGRWVDNVGYIFTHVLLVYPFDVVVFVDVDGGGDGAAFFSISEPQA